MPETLPGESSQLPAPPEHSRGAGEEEAGQEVLKQSGAALRGWGVGVQGWGGGGGWGSPWSTTSLSPLSASVSVPVHQ